jgi:hypothetical protein
MRGSKCPNSGAGLTGVSGHRASVRIRLRRFRWCKEPAYRDVTRQRKMAAQQATPTPLEPDPTGGDP